MTLAEKIKVAWCNLTHGGGKIERDSEGRINWRCATCGRWHEHPVSLEAERRQTDADIAEYMARKEMQQ